MDGDGPAGDVPYYKVGCRYYDGDAGRFISRDTDLNQSPYAYCDGDPVSFTDPDGNKKTKKPIPPTNPAPPANAGGGGTNVNVQNSQGSTVIVTTTGGQGSTSVTVTNSPGANVTVTTGGPAGSSGGSGGSGFGDFITGVAQNATWDFIKYIVRAGASSLPNIPIEP